MKHTVQIGHSDELNPLYGLRTDSFEEGEKVEFRIPFATDTNITVTSDDVDRIETSADSMSYHYSFIMPGHDVHVNVNMVNSMRYNPDDKPAFTMPKGGFVGMGGMLQMQQAQNEGEPKAKRFCPVCGARLQIEGQNFCGNCGESLQ